MVRTERLDLLVAYTKTLLINKLKQSFCQLLVWRRVVYGRFARIPASFFNAIWASPLSDLAHHLFYDKSPPWHIANSRIHPLPNTHPVLTK
jgi:hypothetical protein